MRMVLKSLLLIALTTAIVLTYLWMTINRFQTTGSMQLSSLDAPVTVKRDELAIPYIQAQSLPDALRAQGFITGQDRLYQVQLYRLLALGRLAESFGERAIKNDVMMRVMDINGIAERQLAMLDEPAREFYRYYVEGLNAYIKDHTDEHPFGLKLAGIKAEPWTLQDIIAVQVFQAWSNGGNWRMDILNQQLIDDLGMLGAQKIAQITYNPDDMSVLTANYFDLPVEIDVDPELSPDEPGQDLAGQTTKLNIRLDPQWLQLFPNAIAAGSNSWATGSRKSVSGKPILSSNPHLAANTLPGFLAPDGNVLPRSSRLPAYHHRHRPALGLAGPGILPMRQPWVAVMGRI